MDDELLQISTEWITLQLELSCLYEQGSESERTRVLEDETAHRRTRFHEILSASAVAPALQRLSLTATETASLFTLATIEVEPIAGGFLRRLATEASLAGLRRFVYRGKSSALAFRELGEAGTLRRLGLIEPADRTRSGGEEQRTWVLSRRAMGMLYGDSELAPSLRGIARLDSQLSVGPLPIVEESVMAAVQRSLRAGQGLVLVNGLPGSGRRTLLLAGARQLGISVLEVDASKLSTDCSILGHQLRGVALECKLSAQVPLFVNLEALEGEQRGRLELVASDFAPLIDGLILATCGVNRPAMRWDRPVITIEMGPPTSAQRATLWHTALGQGTEQDAELLATQYPLAPALIHHAAEAAKARAAGKPLEPDDIYAGIRSVLDDRLGQFAKRVTVTQTWDDIVLPQDQLDSVIELMARIRQRRTVYEQWGFAAKVGKGLGVSALFSGPRGTGKTMVAGLIAQDLGLEMYQVDLSKIVSKWIGETEKNLAALFDAAEAGHAILLFDEADSLFGKRTDVKSSNDRNANLETNYLLQRLESFTGICLLTSNHESHIDPAFQRRLSLHLRFELPDDAERAQLWRAMLPAAAPVAPSVDFAALGRRFAMSGGYIRNAALRAAFLAADEGAAISAAHLERAARVEYEGLGKIAA